MAVKRGALMSDALIVKDGQVVSMEYTLTVEDEVVDSSEGDAPLEFLQGGGNIIPGLERAIYGMSVGDSKSVVIQPEDAYGEFDDDAFASVPRADFPKDVPLEEGAELNVTDTDGKEATAYIHSYDDDSVRLDFNHPLAGAKLHFDVKIVGLRGATPEELAHGHVHGHGHHH
jgi:FKBP-type peptidyl-prolyl cis-trans isomerase SlyD